jgi:hypothetical protein
LNEVIAMIELTQMQQKELEETGDIRVLDPGTNTKYVLIKADEFAQLQKFLQQMVDPNEQEAWADAIEETRSDMSHESGMMQLSDISGANGPVQDRSQE